MTLSGFTMCRNAEKLYYPIKESILSILPIVDEFVVALGKGDSDDQSRKLIEEIGSSKIKVIDTIWDTKTFSGGTEFARQTDIAKSHCTGDWLFYIQCDELVHEQDLPLIRENCSIYLNHPQVDGFLFNYLHFWGDYQHLQDSHNWYRKEIRIIRNDPRIHSWRDAQSFRIIPDFDGKSYMKSEGSSKLNVIELKANIFHYGWVRPPHLMTHKIKAFKETKYGKTYVDKMEQAHAVNDSYDYGLMKGLTQFKGSHPQLMVPWIEKLNWQNNLRFSGPLTLNKIPEKHGRLKYRIISFIEKKLLFGMRLGEFRNYKIIKITNK
jgi:hypothetical protein